MVVSRLSCKLSKSNNSRAAPGARGAGEEYSTGRASTTGLVPTTPQQGKQSSKNKQTPPQQTGLKTSILAVSSGREINSVGQS